MHTQAKNSPIVVEDTSYKENIRIENNLKTKRVPSDWSEAYIAQMCKGNGDAQDGSRGENY